MDETLEFPDLLRLIDDRSTAFHGEVAAAPSLDAQVPTCPEWTLFDLVQHLGRSRRFWAAAVTAGLDGASLGESPPKDGPGAPREHEALLAWWAESAQALSDALSAVGPDRGCRTWWGASQSPQTSGAVARHQLQHTAVHTYDAQATLGAARPLPTEVALDGVDEFLSTCCATTSPWPHEPAAIDFHATEGRSWRLRLTADGARSARVPVPGTDEPADASIRGTAGDLVLVLYGRIPVDSLRLSGDRRPFDLLEAWEPA